MSQIHALAAKQAGGKLEPFSYDPGPLGDEQVEIEVQYCGICHSDYSMLHNEFGISQFPLVPGHEAVGKIVAAGDKTKFVKVGQTVGLGWYSGSCLHCRPCLAGNQNMCESLEQTIVARYGAFATRVRCHWCWAFPPEGIDPAKAGPLFCGGITVFNPLVQFNVKPTDRVGVIGVGGLGHLAIQFLNKWGCHVTAFTTSASKAEEAKNMGAHAVINTRSPDELSKAAGSFDFILSTAAASEMNWDSYVAALAPKGRLNIVGIVPQITVALFPLLAAQRSISASPSGTPTTVLSMLDFCARHNIAPVTEEFPMSKANEALAHLEAGKARYRIVLKNDLS
ncbi:MAG TPA: NAD(P)-dependent alcohol dehydrogenase [Bryobacteraceae bacterium]